MNKFYLCLYSRLSMLALIQTSASLSCIQYKAFGNIPSYQPATEGWDKIKVMIVLVTCHDSIQLMRWSERQRALLRRPKYWLKSEWSRHRKSNACLTAIQTWSIACSAAHYQAWASNHLVLKLWDVSETCKAQPCSVLLQSFAWHNVKSIILPAMKLVQELKSLLQSEGNLG